MRTARSIAFLGIAFALRGTPALAEIEPYPVTTTTSVTAATVARAKSAFTQIAEGTIDRSALTPSLSADMTNDVAAALKQKATSLGTYDKFVAVGQTDTNGITSTVFRLHFPDGFLDFNFGVDDASGRIAQLYFVPGPSNDPT